ncbi:MAG TPA: prenyltransferase [Kofleriaceae bacterium]|nr:prenyltransferase [Kofleriaceae bacterium]
MWRVAGGEAAAVVMVMGLLAWEYSAPPLRLCGTGFGELDTALVVTGLVPLLGFVLQAPGLQGTVGTAGAMAAAGLPGTGGLGVLGLAIVAPALLQVAMLIAIEFPDAVGDAKTGKRTLVVRLGAARAAWVYVAITGLAYGWLPVAVGLGLPGRVAWCAALPAPIAAWRMWRVGEHRDPKAYERLTFFAVFLLVATSLAEVGALVSLRLAAGR